MPLAPQDASAYGYVDSFDFGRRLSPRMYLTAYPIPDSSKRYLLVDPSAADDLT